MIPFGRAVALGIAPMAVMVCGAQMGKTDELLDIIGERLDTRPAPILYVGPSKEFNTDQFEPRVTELLSQARSLGRKVSRARRSKATLKWIAGVRLRLAHAGSSTALKSDPAALALVDEYDEMLKNVKGQGDPLGLVRARGFTYADFTTAVTSTPSNGLVDSEFDLASGLEFWKASPPEDLESAIWKLFQSGTMHHWAWPCPHCDNFFIPRLKLLRWPEGASAARAGREAWLECPHCKAKIFDERDGEAKGKTKAAMNARGVMICRGQWLEAGVVTGEPAIDSDTLSYWVSGLASPFVSWGERAAALVEAEEKQEGKQTAINAGGGELYAPGGGEVPEWKEVLGLRRTYQEESLPLGAVVLTAGIDVQRKKLVYVIRAWGARATSWLVKAGELYGPTHEPEVWSALQDLLAMRFVGPGIPGLPVKVAFIDSGFRPGKPDVIPENMVYEFCRRNARFVFPSKGHDVQMTPIRRSKIEVEPAGGAAKFGLELMHLDSDYFKRWVHERIRWPEAQPGGFYLYEKATEDYARQIVSEARTIGPSNKPVWMRRTRDNHYLDCEAMAAAAGYLLNVQRIGVNPKPEDEEGPPSPPPEKGSTAAPEASPTSTDAVREKFGKMAAQMNLRRK